MRLVQRPLPPKIDRCAQRLNLRHRIIQQQQQFVQALYSLLSLLPFVPCRRVVRAASLALCSLTLKNQANKTRCGSLDAVAILMDLAAAWGIAEEGEKTKSFGALTSHSLTHEGTYPGTQTLRHAGTGSFHGRRSPEAPKIKSAEP